MKSIFQHTLFSTIVACALALGFILCAAPADAQTRKRTTKKRVNPVTTSVPQPVVISQADEYQNQNQQIITGETPVDSETPPVDQTVTEEPQSVDAKIEDLRRQIDELSAGSKSKKNDYDEKQRRLALNLDILTKAEQRSESLRKQLFELTERENNLKTKLDTIDYEMRPETIARQVAMAGSLRPEELRESRRKTLEADRRNIQNLLLEIQTQRTNLELTVQRADLMVEKLRFKLEKEIDEALTDEPKN